MVKLIEARLKSASIFELEDFSFGRILTGLSRRILRNQNLKARPLRSTKKSSTTPSTTFINNFFPHILTNQILAVLSC